MAKLTAKKRKRLSTSSFALPGRRYPINDRAHARNALARVAQHGTPSERSRVRAAVRRRYPGMAVTGGGRKRTTKRKGTTRRRSSARRRRR